MKVLYPGSFDPPTKGHIAVIERAASLFDQVVVAVMVNKAKRYWYDDEVRADMIRRCVLGHSNVTVVVHRGLLVDCAKECSVDAVVRGIRDVSDYASERPVADAIYALNGVETLFLPSDPKLGHIYSSFVREILSFGGSVDELVPECILHDVYHLAMGTTRFDGR